MTELWKPIAGYETVYEVSNKGNVRRIGSRKKGVTPGRILKGRQNKDGYIRVALWDAPRKPIDRFIHVLVLETFVGPRPPGMESCHRDGKRSHNSVNNLYWGTPSQNAADKLAHGTQASGERHGNARLTRDQVDEIRLSHLSQTDVAKIFGISQQHVSDIRRGHKWLKEPTK